MSDVTMNPADRINEIGAALGKVPLKAEDRRALLAELSVMTSMLAASASVGSIDAVGTVEEVDVDETEMERINGAMDPFPGAIIEAGWHHVNVPEPPVGLGLPSNKLKFLRLGYEIAPAVDEETRKNWDEARSWVMRISQKTYDARVERSRQASRSNRAIAHDTKPGMVVTKASQKVTNLGALGVTPDMNG